MMKKQHQVSNQSNMVMQSVSSPKLFDMIERRKWRKLRRVLKSKKGPELCRETDLTGLSCLGVALGFQAPIKIIQLMISTSPRLIDYRDSFGAGCLHIACLNGSSLESIDYLLENYTYLKITVDKDNRAPLHHSVEFACQCQDGEDEEYYLELIGTIYKAEPRMIHSSDNSGDSPLDLVHMFMTSCDAKNLQRLEKIYQLVHGLSVKHFMDKKLRWEEEGYDKCYLDTGDKDEISSLKSKSTVSTMSCSDRSPFQGSTVVAEGPDSIRDQEVQSIMDDSSKS